MQMEDAEKLRKAWGYKPCDHPSIAKEFRNEIATGDFVCTQCGATFTQFQAKAIEANRNKKRSM